jgi:hypothetical protein
MRSSPEAATLLVMPETNTTSNQLDDGLAIDRHVWCATLAYEGNDVALRGLQHEMTNVAAEHARFVWLEARFVTVTFLRHD